MKKYSENELKTLNQQFKGISPSEIIQWAVERNDRPVVTTNFSPYEAAILKACVKIAPKMTVIWCDSGYNTPQTYLHARSVIEELDLNMKVYSPLQTAAYRDAFFGGIPQIDNALHDEFTRQVQLEPFQRAMKEQLPDVWFTNLRKEQTAFSDSLEILNYSKDGVLMISPFCHWTDKQLDKYLLQENSPNEFKYFDLTRVLGNREWGLQA